MFSEARSLAITKWGTDHRVDDAWTSTRAELPELNSQLLGASIIPDNIHHQHPPLQLTHAAHRRICPDFFFAAFAHRSCLFQQIISISIPQSPRWSSATRAS